MNETPSPGQRSSDPAWSAARRLVLVFAVLVVAAAARWPNLTESLWTDEIVYTHVMLAGKSLDWVLFHDVHPPLYALILYGWIMVFGDSELAVRMPSLLFGLASLVAVFALARRGFGDRVALLTMTLTALSPAHIWYSQENKTNMLVVLLTIAVIWRLQAAWTTNRWRDWIGFVAVSALALWAHAFSLFVVLTSFAWLGLQLFRPSGRTRLRGALLSVGLVAASSAPLVHAFFREGEKLERAYLRAFTLPEVYKFVLIYLSHGNTLRTISPYADLGTLFGQPVYLFLFDGFYALLTVLGIGAAVACWRRPGTKADPGAAVSGRPTSELLVAYFVLPMIALLLGSLVYPKIFVERSMLIVLPPFLILIAFGVLSLPRPRWRRVAVAAVLILNLFALHALWVTRADAWTVYKQNPDWRSAVRHVVRERTRSPSRLVPVVTTGPEGVVLYYLAQEQARLRGRTRRTPQVVVLQAGAADREPIHRAFSRDGIRMIFLLRNRYWDEDNGRLLAGLQGDPRYRFVQHTPYKGIDVFEIHRIDCTTSRGRR